MPHCLQTIKPMGVCLSALDRFACLRDECLRLGKGAIFQYKKLNIKYQKFSLL